MNNNLVTIFTKNGPVNFSRTPNLFKVCKICNKTYSRSNKSHHDKTKDHVKCLHVLELIKNKNYDLISISI